MTPTDLKTIRRYAAAVRRWLKEIDARSTQSSNQARL